MIACMHAAALAAATAVFFFLFVSAFGPPSHMPKIGGGPPDVVSISDLVVEYIVAIDATRARFPADAFCGAGAAGGGGAALAG